MPNQATRGISQAGHFRAAQYTIGSGAARLSGVFLTGNALISPANSTVAANSVEERSYTTGLTNLALVAGDLVMVNPVTALASGLGIGWVRCVSANTLHVGWINASGGATAPGPTTYRVVAVRLGG